MPNKASLSLPPRSCAEKIYELFLALNVARRYETVKTEKMNRFDDIEV